MKLDPKALKKLDRALSKGFEKTVKVYADNCKTAIEAEVYDWTDKTTYRQNGEIVTSPRDSDDTGELKNSQQEPVFDGDTASIEWTAPHAITVHEGWKDQSIYPGRPWTDEAKSNTDFTGIMKAEIRKQLD